MVLLVGLKSSSHSKVASEPGCGGLYCTSLIRMSPLLAVVLLVVDVLLEVGVAVGEVVGVALGVGDGVGETIGVAGSSARQGLGLGLSTKLPPAGERSSEWPSSTFL